MKSLLISLVFSLTLVSDQVDCLSLQHRRQLLAGLLGGYAGASTLAAQQSVASANDNVLLASNAEATADSNINTPTSKTKKSSSSSSSSSSSPGLASRLAKRNPNELQNRLFNVPPSVQVYPDWMIGDWQLTCSFNGYIFPSQTLSRQRVLSDYEIPGFQKCSIANTADVGLDSVQYNFRIDPTTRTEDRNYNLIQSINAHLKYNAVRDVLYQPKSNPNRLSIEFVPYRTINAERIELFVNGRESELIVSSDTNNSGEVFVCSEYIRQVTFGTGSTVGIPRQVITNYGLFWTWKQGMSTDASRDNNNDDARHEMQGNLLTAGYLDPQDPLYFEEPLRPVVVYSHTLRAQPIRVI